MLKYSYIIFNGVFMDITKEEILKLINQYDHTKYVHKEDFPNIDLYMDQVISFVEKHLDQSSDSDQKFLTKTMINNYAKSKLFPPPIKKKYNTEHIISFCIIYYLKKFLSIDDVKTILNGMQNDTDLYQLYLNMIEEIKLCLPDSSNDIIQKLNKSFSKENIENNQAIYLFIAQLSYDVYVRKEILETMAKIARNKINNQDKTEDNV